MNDISIIKNKNFSRLLFVFVNRVMLLTFASCLVFTTTMALIPKVEIPDMFNVRDGNPPTKRLH